VLPNDQRFEMTDHQEIIKTLANEQVQRTDENRSALMERPVQTKEAPELKEDLAQRHESVSTGAWQNFTSQNHENGMEWSGRDQREQPSADQLGAPSAMTETSAPAVPSNPTLPVNGLDQRAFSSAPSAKLPADAHPAITTPPVTPTDWMPGNSASQTKSMVLELSRADLGQVNIRVAVNQDVVHTYFSSDRSDMGQYLQNGQERLQSALQTSGLDLGRFQVDIDRQSAGRSFQQPASQGQSNGHSSHGESRSPGQEREEFTRDTTPRRGMLNLVA
jgi:flagellar hook-length control protein FliK